MGTTFEAVAAVGVLVGKGAHVYEEQCIQTGGAAGGFLYGLHVEELRLDGGF